MGKPSLEIQSMTLCGKSSKLDTSYHKYENIVYVHGSKNALLIYYFGIVLRHNTSCVMVKHFAR